MIVIKENGNLVGLFHNKAEDIFLKNTVNALGLDTNALEVYDFTANCGVICKYEREEGKFYEMDGDKIRLKSIQIEAEYEPRLIEPSDLNALDYYTQAFIDEYNSNKAAEALYLESNPDLTGFSYAYPDSLEHNFIFGEALNVPPVIIEDQVITGTPVDVAAKIAQEESESSTHK